jgi:hypothetical protein
VSRVCVARVIDKEIGRLLDAQTERAQRTLEAHRLFSKPSPRR